MLKTEAEQIVRRVMEETEAQFTDQQVEALSRAIIKITTRMIEEALSTFRPGKSGKPPYFD